MAAVPSGNAHMGDIMSYSETTNISQEGELAAFTPLQRIALTANGNLQRILSAFFNSRVAVVIKKNKLVEYLPGKRAVFEREVEIVSYSAEGSGRSCCIATSTVTISDLEMMSLVMNEALGIGIGQIFRHLNILPSFNLVRVGRQKDVFFRDYVLSSRGIECEIHESFPDDLFLS